MANPYGSLTSAIASGSNPNFLPGTKYPDPTRRINPAQVPMDPNPPVAMNSYGRGMDAGDTPAPISTTPIQTPEPITPRGAVPAPNSPDSGSNMIPPASTPASAVPQNANNPWANVGQPQNLPTAAPVDLATALAQLQPISDATYNEQTRHLDPQFQQQEQAFRNRMNARGIPEGSAAYNAAMDDFSRGRNDAYGSARNQSLASALAAQNQFAQQDIANRGLGLQGLSIQNQSDQWNRNFGEDTRRYDQGFGEDQRRYDQGFGEDTRRYDLGRGDMLAQQDWDNGYSMMDFDRGTAQMNHNWDNDNFARQLALLGFMPNGQPTGVDVNGPYALASGQYNANQAANAASQNGRWGALGQLGAAFFCDREAKDTVGEMSPDKCLEAVEHIPVDLWNYKGDETQHVGTYAQDFYKALGLPPRKQIDSIDIVGVLMGAVKGLLAKVEALEAR